MRWSIEDFVYSGTDGVVTTFVIVTGSIWGFITCIGYIDSTFC